MTDTLARSIRRLPDDIGLNIKSLTTTIRLKTANRFLTLIYYDIMSHPTDASYSFPVSKITKYCRA